jgi:hypothetical protein
MRAKMKRFNVQSKLKVWCSKIQAAKHSMQKLIHFRLVIPAK